MKATALLQHLEDYLKPLIEDSDQGGVFSVAADSQEALESLAGNAPKRWRCVLVWAGYETVASDDSGSGGGFADSALHLFIQLPAGFGSPNTELHRSQPGGNPPMLDRIEFVILLMRRLRLNVDGVDCRQFRFITSEWEAETKSGKALARTHRLEFRVVTALDEADVPYLFTPG